MLQQALSYDQCHSSCICSLTDPDSAQNRREFPANIYRKGQVLFYQDTRPMGVFIIRQGVVKLSNLDSHGREHIISIAQAGDVMGYGYLMDNQLYQVSATTLRETKACFIPGPDFLEALQNDCFKTKLLKMSIKELRFTRQRLADQAQRSVRERLASTILMLYETCGSEESNQVIDLALSRRDLANIVGTATETLIRLLSEFKRDGLIKIINGKIHLLDRSRLVRESDLYDVNRL